MTLPASNALSMSQVNTEVGAAATANRSMSWVQSNTFYAYDNMNALHSLAWFQAVSSKNSVSRSAEATTTNCTQNCYAPSANCQYVPPCDGDSGWLPYAAPNYAAPTAAVNCNQCGYSHGQYLQANCNCNCNCYNCNCSSTACAPPCACDCG